MRSSSSNIISSSKTILIVDDDEITQEALSRGFENCGFKTFKAKNANDVWVLFNSRHIDYVLTDVWISGLNGMELSRKIKEKSPLTKIALMTGGKTENVKKLIDEGTVNHFFWKPFNIKSICIQSICKIFNTEMQIAQ